MSNKEALRKMAAEMALIHRIKNRQLKIQGLRKESLENLTSTWHIEDNERRGK